MFQENFALVLKSATSTRRGTEREGHAYYFVAGSDLRRFIIARWLSRWAISHSHLQNSITCAANETPLLISTAPTTAYDLIFASFGTKLILIPTTSQYYRNVVLPVSGVGALSLIQTTIFLSLFGSSTSNALVPSKEIPASLHLLTCSSAG